MMVQMPTGIGKLHSLASVIHEHLQERQRQSVWIATHRRELVEQIEDTVVRYGIRKEEGLVCSSQWLSHHWEDVENDRSDLIVIDEAHRALAETYKELWAHYPDAKIRQTATPCLMKRRGSTDLFGILVASDSIPP